MPDFVWKRKPFWQQRDQRESRAHNQGCMGNFRSSVDFGFCNIRNIGQPNAGMFSRCGRHNFAAAGPLEISSARLPG